MEDTAVMEYQQAPTLLQENDPTLMVEQATEIANVLADIIEKKKLYKKIGSKKHVYVEGWTTLGAMLKIFPDVEYTKRLEREDEIAYEARVTVKTLEGTVIGHADSMCSSKESNWRNRDEYAIRSMAQTRTVGKALRLPLGWIMTLAGYSATPAEEMTKDMEKSSSKPRPTRRPPSSRPTTEKTQTPPADPEDANQSGSNVPPGVDPNKVKDAETTTKPRPKRQTPPGLRPLEEIEINHLKKKNPDLNKVITFLDEDNADICSKSIIMKLQDMLGDPNLPDFDKEAFRQAKEDLHSK